jgi:phosphate transport system protein
VREILISPRQGRDGLVRGLVDTEAQTLRELALVRSSLAAAVESAITGDAAIADSVKDDKVGFDRRYRGMHARLLSLMSHQSPVDVDLRLAMALAYVKDRIDLIGGQCVRIASLCFAATEDARPRDSQLECLHEMAGLADRQLADAGSLFGDRAVDEIGSLLARCAAIDDCNRRCFSAGAVGGVDAGQIETAFFVALVGRSLERIGDNAVDIAQQAAFVATGKVTAATGD